MSGLGYRLRRRWPNDEISAIKLRDESWVEVGSGTHGGSHLDNPQPNWLADFMINGTWPVPVIVLANDCQATDPSGNPLPAPYVLIEGHRRMAYLGSGPIKTLAP